MAVRAVDSDIDLTRECHMEDLAKCFARCFRGADGERAIAHLKAQTLDIAAGPDIADSRLRHLEGQRFMVRTIINLIERGRQ
jgi:hypothetical protein